MLYNNTMLKLEKIENQVNYDKFLNQLSGHPLQLWGWGDVKSLHGWRAERFLIYKDKKVVGAVQILLKKLPLSFGWYCYIPRGIATDNKYSAEVYQKVGEYCKLNYKVVCITIEPDEKTPKKLKKWKKTENNILLAKTVQLDLKKTQDQLLADMSKKTRQYVRKSEKNGIKIEQVSTKDELEKCLKIYKDTARRANFALHNDTYYYDIFDKMINGNKIYAAYYEDSMVAFVWLIASDYLAFELYGGVLDAGQKSRANYYLKWYAINDIKKSGVKQYDMNGLLNDGVSKFKEGFSTNNTHKPGTYDYPASILYPVWRYGLPNIKKVVRFVKSRQ